MSHIPLNVRGNVTLNLHSTFFDSGVLNCDYCSRENFKTIARLLKHFKYVLDQSTVLSKLAISDALICLQFTAFRHQTRDRLIPFQDHLLYSLHQSVANYAPILLPGSQDPLIKVSFVVFSTSLSITLSIISCVSALWSWRQPFVLVTSVIVKNVRTDLKDNHCAFLESISASIRWF